MHTTVIGNLNNTGTSPFSCKIATKIQSQYLFMPVSHPSKCVNIEGQDNKHLSKDMFAISATTIFDSFYYIHELVTKWLGHDSANLDKIAITKYDQIHFCRQTGVGSRQKSTASYFLAGLYTRANLADLIHEWFDHCYRSPHFNFLQNYFISTV